MYDLTSYFPQELAQDAPKIIDSTLLFVGADKLSQREWVLDENI